jgi:acid phosphatase (class A)
MPKLDYNYNYNYNYTAAGGGGLRFRPRDNTDIFARLVDTTTTGVFVVPARVGSSYPAFHTNWDADLRSYMFLDQFLKAPHVTAAPGWRSRYSTVASNAGAPPQSMLRGTLQGEVLQILNLALEREDRYSEVIDQDDGDGAINYYLGMLKIDPARHPMTNLMIRVGRRIGEHIVMCLKGDFASPRPSQLCPAITPMIDPPVTPSFPAGHAVQSYLISYLLAYTLPNLPQHVLPNPPVPPTMTSLGSVGTGLLFDLAARISQNRIVAGVHYPTDIVAGLAVAIECFNDLQKGGLITSLTNDVKGEFPQYK